MRPRISADEKEQIEAKIEELRTTLKASNASATELQSATDALLTASQVLGQRVYEAAQAQAPESGDDAGDDDVVDAEIIEEGDDS